ncbi:hypothetical protein AYO44_03615 [Planctomycetaceae bacterium SCGC AG-212-F19]|nr:hypothetical protein AYO44_03615 [Planctomycetaceae bacterium SCGC AG-212-F19]
MSAWQERGDYRAALPDAPTPEAYVEALSETFASAAAAVGGPCDYYFDLADFRVRVRFAGPALLDRLGEALAHRAMPHGPAALTICVWDSASTGVSLPCKAWEWSDSWRRGLIQGFNNQRFRTLFQHNLEAFSILDARRGLAFYWMQDAACCPSFERGAPFRYIFHWWLSRQGRYLVHAGAVGTSAGGVLLAGKGGSGKSSTALACLPSELLHAGDDYVLIAERPDPFVYSLYQSTKLLADQLPRFPHLARAVSNADQLDREKALIFLQQGYARKLVAGFPIKAILLPRVTGLRDTRLQPATPTQTLAALAPSTVVQLHGLDKNSLQAMVSMAHGVPSFALELGTDRAQIPSVIQSLLTPG